MNKNILICTGVIFLCGAPTYADMLKCGSDGYCCDSGTCNTHGCYEIYNGSDVPYGFICEDVTPNATCTCTKNGQTTLIPMYCQVGENCADGYTCNGSWQCIPEDAQECPPGEWYPIDEEYLPGYLARELKIMEDWGCDSAGEYEVQCDIGYWGIAEWPDGDDPIGCAACPFLDGVWGKTKWPGSTQQTQCYIPAYTDLKFSDTTGNGTYYFNNDCYYQK